MADAEHPATLDLTALDDAGFARLYESRIKPGFDAHEPERVAAVATFKQRLMIGLGLTALAAIVASLLARDIAFGFFAAIAGGFIAYAWSMAKLNAVRAKVKEASCKAIAESIGVLFWPDVGQPPAFQRQRELGLLPAHDRAKFEDLFQGSYRDAQFDLYEAHLEQRHRDSKGRTSYTTVFRGQVIRLSFPRKFLGITIVRRDAGMFNVFGEMFAGKGLKRVGLEDPVFEKAFEVYGTDQVEARYLLHPAFMQRLVDLETALKGKRLRCAFEQGDLLIAVEGGNLFEPGDMFKPLAQPERARRIVDDVASVLRVMDGVLTAQARRG